MSASPKESLIECPNMHLKPQVKDRCASIQKDNKDNSLAQENIGGQTCNVFCISSLQALKLLEL
uniref:Uncharacterized protein n=1 Tax=Anguilla anguilla TaxID=7936 RepID=A0A0E9VLN7_ANGAN